MDSAGVSGLEPTVIDEIERLVQILERGIVEHQLPVSLHRLLREMPNTPKRRAFKRRAGISPQHGTKTVQTTLETNLLLF